MALAKGTRGTTTSISVCAVSTIIVLSLTRTFHSAPKSPSINFVSMTPAESKGCASARGQGYLIFCPRYEFDLTKSPQVLAPPENWILGLTERFKWLDLLVAESDDRSINVRSINSYLEVLQMYVTGLCYGEEEKSVNPALGQKLVHVGPLNVGARQRGNDWTYMGSTMTGGERLKNVRNLLIDVFQNEVGGDYMEAGVWRGGSSVFARGVILAHGQQHRRSFVLDSFRGLPPGERKFDQGDAGWDNSAYLEVSADVVAGNFNSAGLLDENVVFAQGFFNDTIPPLLNTIESLAIIRFDGDIYESAVDVLYNLYGKLSVGGYFIVDDWFGFPSRTACEDFFAVHGISPDITPIDDLSVYWKKTENVTVQYWRYEQSQFK
jgi:O-methyltransferase